MNALGRGRELTKDRPAPGAEPELQSAAGALAAAMAEWNAGCGAVVSMAGREVRIDASAPDAGWLRSVDLYIARTLLLRRGALTDPLLAASDRFYIAITAARGPAIIILSEP